MQSERQVGPNSKAGLERPTSKARWLDRCKPISGPRARDGGAAAGSLRFGSSGTRSTTSADAGTARPYEKSFRSLRYPADTNNNTTPFHPSLLRLQGLPHKACCAYQKSCTRCCALLLVGGKIELFWIFTSNSSWMTWTNHGPDA